MMHNAISYSLRYAKGNFTNLTHFCKVYSVQCRTHCRFCGWLSVKSRTKCYSSKQNFNFFKSSYINTFKPISTFCYLQNKDSEVPVPDENLQKVLDDEEFQSILQDFAKDFDVGDDANKILDEIKKQNDCEQQLKDRSKDECEGKNSKDEVLEAYYALAEEKYKEFRDVDSTVILSAEEEEQELSDIVESDTFFHIDQEYKSKTYDAYVKRGLTGVYDIDELVAVLREEKVFDISVISIPESYHYTDYMVLATAKSPRHSTAVTENIKKLYKRKKNAKDPFMKVEGEEKCAWKAIDMGNIVLHVFLEDTRIMYDIESMWLLDSQYDSGGSIQQDQVLEMLQEQMEFFNALKSNEAPVEEKLV